MSLAIMWVQQKYLQIQSNKLCESDVHESTKNSLKNELLQGYLSTGKISRKNSVKENQILGLKNLLWNNSQSFK